MKSEITVKEIENMNYEEKNLIQKLKRAEEQIKNGEVIDADLVFAEMREKYGY